MPYYIECTSDLKYLMDYYFDGKPPMSERRPFFRGDDLSDSDIKQFPNKMVITNVKDPAHVPGIIANAGYPGFVNREIKEYLEENDKEVHRFFPITVHLDGTNIDLEYYYLYISNKISSICVQKTAFTKGIGQDAAKKSKFHLKKDSEGNVQCYLYKENVAGSNIWRCPENENLMMFFCSDAFASFIKSRDIHGWVLYACEWED